MSLVFSLCSVLAGMMQLHLFRSASARELEQNVSCWRLELE